MPAFAIPTAVKAAFMGILLLLVVGGAWMLRDELIAKGENIIKAQDNAALVKAQADQAKRDAVLIASQNDYINTLQNSGNTVKEKIRVVQAPCGPNDGRGDARLDDAASWVRGQLAPGGVPAAGGPQPKAAVPTPSAAAASRSSPVR